MRYRVLSQGVKGELAKRGRGITRYITSRGHGDGT